VIASFWDILSDLQPRRQTIAIIHSSEALFTTTLPPNGRKWIYPGNSLLYRDNSEPAESQWIPSLPYPSAAIGRESIIFCPCGQYFSSKWVDETK
jgi:hypothetical protein